MILNDRDFIIINNCTKNIPLHSKHHWLDHRGTSSLTGVLEGRGQSHSGLCCCFSACSSWFKVLKGICLLLHHLFFVLRAGRLHIGFRTAWSVRSQRIPSGFEQLFWAPVQTKRAGARSGVVHDASRGVNGRRGWRQPPWPVVVLGESDRLQRSQGRSVAAMRRRRRWGEGQRVVVVQGKMGEVRREERVRQGGGRRSAAHQECSQGVDKGVRPR